MDLTPSEFEELVSDAIDQIPTDLMREVDNVAVLIEAEPPADQPYLLGLYQGVPLTKRNIGWGQVGQPDRISIYRGPLQRMCATREELVHQVKVTVVHEIAHYFGIDDDRLHELGWG